jgi:hypothetical protein
MLTALLFLAAAAVHVYRLLEPFEIVVNGTVVPPWASIVAAALASLIALMLLREARR